MTKAERAPCEAVSRVLFRRESLLVGGLASLLDEYRLCTGYPVGRGRVILNPVSSAVSDSCRHEPFGRNLLEVVGSDTVLHAPASRMYPRKNHGFLPKVRDLLLAQGVNLKFEGTRSRGSCRVYQTDSETHVSMSERRPSPKSRILAESATQAAPDLAKG